MSEQKQFSGEVIEKLGHYVYRLIDPRSGMTFYVGRGQGNRVFTHAAGKECPSKLEDDETLKLKTIWAIRNAGFEAQHVIHRHGMEGDTAKEVEAALIQAYPGLTNIQAGFDGARGLMHADEVIRVYEAKPATFQHNLMLINVNKSSEEQDVYNAVRFSWKISLKTVKLADYVLAVKRGLIIGVFEVDEWLEGTKKNFPGMVRNGYAPRDGRFGFIGHEASQDIADLYLFKRVPGEFKKNGAANPIRYVGAAFAKHPH